jgi:hypothetical protein
MHLESGFAADRESTSCYESKKFNIKKNRWYLLKMLVNKRIIEDNFKQLMLWNAKAI